MGALWKWFGVAWFAWHNSNEDQWSVSCHKTCYLWWHWGEIIWCCCCCIHSCPDAFKDSNCWSVVIIFPFASIKIAIRWFACSLPHPQPHVFFLLKYLVFLLILFLPISVEKLKKEMKEKLAPCSWQAVKFSTTVTRLLRMVTLVKCKFYFVVLGYFMCPFTTKKGSLFSDLFASLSSKFQICSKAGKSTI